MQNIALKPSEAAELLGVSAGTIRNLAHRKHNPLPSFSIGTTTQQIRIPYLALVNWANAEAGFEINLKEVLEG